MVTVIDEGAGRGQSAVVVEFTGRRLLCFDGEVEATCIVRNEVNGMRGADQVVYTYGSTHPHGLAYQPRRFPAGTHEITRVVDMGYDTAFWPVYMDTSATQELPVWELSTDKEYKRELARTFTGRGYGIHHARFRRGRQLVPSRTTLGCINVIEPDDMRWLADEVRTAMAYRRRVFVYVPPWDEWEE